MDSRSFSDIRHADDAGQGVSSSTVQPAGADRTENFGFYHLPLELRLQIYKNIFSDHADTDHTNATSPFGKMSRDRIRARVQPPKHLSVAMTSKQIYREALPILYRTYHFRLSMWDDGISKQSSRQLTGQLLAQLRRPMALLMLPSISYLDLFIQGGVAAFSECVSSVLQSINHSCVGLQTFCLHMDQLPCSWTREAKELVAELANGAPFELERSNSLRGLANRVRVFRINICLFQWYLQYDSFLKDLIPGSTWLLNRNRDGDSMSWVCQGTEGRKSMTFWKD